MSPDSVEARLGRMETAVARLEQRTDDLATDVRTLAPLVVAVAEVKLAITHVESESRGTRAAIDGVHRRLDDDEKDRKRRQEEASKDSRSLRNILIGVGCAAVLSPIGGILVALIVGKA
jgi:uncharacterized protein YoxC